MFRVGGGFTRRVVGGSARHRAIELAKPLTGRLGGRLEGKNGVGREDREEPLFLMTLTEKRDFRWEQFSRCRWGLEVPVDFPTRINLVDERRKRRRKSWGKSDGGGGDDFRTWAQ